MLAVEPLRPISNDFTSAVPTVSPDPRVSNHSLLGYRDISLDFPNSTQFNQTRDGFPRSPTVPKLCPFRDLGPEAVGSYRAGRCFSMP